MQHEERQAIEEHARVQGIVIGIVLGLGCAFVAPYLKEFLTLLV